MRGNCRSDRATAATIRSVCVTLTPCDRSITGMRRSRAPLRPVASTSRIRKKCGTVVQLCVVRSAMMRPIEVTEPSSVEGTRGACGVDGRAASGGGAEAGRAAAGAGAARAAPCRPPS